MNGQLSEQPLAELIREVFIKRISGRLRLRHELIEAAVYFRDGVLIYAASNVRTLRLSEYLRLSELIPDDALRRFQTVRSDLALAEALATEELLAPAVLEKLQVKQVSDVLRVSLLWTAGTWEFSSRAKLREQVNFKIDTTTILLESVRRTPLNLVSSRFRDPNELFSRAAGSVEINNLVPEEGFLLSRLESPTKLSDLVALSGMRELDALRVIYGLAVAGILEREHGTNILSDEMARPQPAIKQPEDTGLSGDEALKAKSEAETTEENLDEFLGRVAAAISHYEVLEVRSEATSAEIKHAYYELARRYHPDKFRMRDTTSLSARIDSAFARITQAYETLMDEGRRAGYNSKLKARALTKDFARTAPKSNASVQPSVSSQMGGQPASDPSADLQRAEANFKDGYAALQQGQTNVAINLLSLAVRAAPNESRYRAYYGHALATNESTRRLAETELHAALKLEPNNYQYRLMLSKLYRDLGFPRRARGEAERALALDPNNVEARELLRALN